MTDTPDQYPRSPLGDQLRQIAIDLQCRPDWIVATIRLAQIYQRHRHLLWPDGDVAATNAYIESNALAITETLARLYDGAVAQEHVPLAWYEGMAPLLAEIKGLAHGGRARLDA
jgi:hypothetical protein